MIKFTKKVEVSSYKEYNEAVNRKYKTNEGMYEGTFVSFQVRDVEKAKQLLQEVPVDNNLHHILQEYIEHNGQKSKDLGDRVGILVGIEMTHEDNYYIQTDGEKEWYTSCVGKLDYIKK